MFDTPNLKQKLHDAFISIRENLNQLLNKFDTKADVEHYHEQYAEEIWVNENFNNYTLENHGNDKHDETYATTNQLFSGSYTDLADIPSNFTPESHKHNATDIDSGTLSESRLPSSALIGDTTYSAGSGLKLENTEFSLSGDSFNNNGDYTDLRARSTTKEDVGLSDVDNVKQAPHSHVGDTGNAHGVATNSTDGFMSSDDKTKLNGIESNANNYTLETHGDNKHSEDYEKVDNKGTGGGYASLDSNAKIPLSQLPDISKQQTYVQESTETRPESPLSGDKLFETDTGDSYIYDGSSWVLMADADWENINLNWGNIINKPSTYTPAQHDNSSHSETYATTNQLFSGDYEDLSNIPNTFTPAAHTHDTQYYTEEEIDDKLSSKSNTDHKHDDRYYTESEINALLDGTSATGHTHDSRYYTEAEIDNMLEDKSDINHTHNYASSSHTHDSRYYTESQIDTLLADKSDIGHTHNYLPVSGGVVTGDLTVENDIYMTENQKVATMNWVNNNFNNYSLPVASASTLGGVKVGNRLSISNGTLSADSQTDNNFTNILKSKLDNIESEANNYTLETHGNEKHSENYLTQDDIQIDDIGKVSYFQTTKPTDVSEGSTWFNPSTNILWIADGEEYNPIPPIQVTEEVLNFYEPELTITYNNTARIDSSLAATVRFKNTEILGNTESDDDFGIILRMIVSGNYAFVLTTYDNLTSIDISDVTNPTKLDAFSHSRYLAVPIDFVIQGDYAYVAMRDDDNYSGLTIFDISDPANITFISNYVDGSRYHYIETLDIKGNYVYLTINGKNKMAIIDVSDPNNPYEVGYITDDHFEGLSGFTIVGDFGYGVNAIDEFVSIDLSNPLSPSYLDGIVDSESFSFAKSIFINSDVTKAYHTNNSDDVISIIDISDPANLSVLGSFSDVHTISSPCYVWTADDSFLLLRSISEDDIILLDIRDFNDIKIADRIKDFGGGLPLVVKDNIAFFIDNDSVYAVNVEYTLSGYAYVEINQPRDLKSWDLVTYQITEDNEIVTIDIETSNDDGETWITEFEDIDQNFDISTIPPGDLVRFKVNIERENPDNNPTCDYLARRFVR